MTLVPVEVGKNTKIVVGGMNKKVLNVQEYREQIDRIHQLKDSLGESL